MGQERGDAAARKYYNNVKPDVRTLQRGCSRVLKYLLCFFMYVNHGLCQKSSQNQLSEEWSYPLKLSGFCLQSVALREPPLTLTSFCAQIFTHLSMFCASIRIVSPRRVTPVSFRRRRTANYTEKQMLSA